MFSIEDEMISLITEIISWVEKVLNSNEHVKLDEGFSLLVQVYEVPAGSCSHKVPERILAQLKKLRSVIQVRNGKDKMCLARCFVIADVLVKFGPGTPELRRVVDQQYHQKNEATKLLKELDLPDREMTLDDLPHFSKKFPNYRIRVYGLDQRCAVIYDNKVDSEQVVHLLHHSHHFAVLKSLSGFFSKSYWCLKCDKGYDHRLKHRCGSICEDCHTSECPQTKDLRLECGDCQRTFGSQECFSKHQSNLSSAGKKQVPICLRVHRCLNCSFHYRADRKPDDQPHRCGEQLCQVCHLHFLPDHKCYIKPLKFSDEKEEEHSAARFLFFDYETYVREDGQLVPNLAVVRDDQGNEHVFPEDGIIGPDVTKALCEFLFQDVHKGFYVIAHNFQSFDGMFILRWLLNNSVKCDVIMAGGKIKNISVPAYKMLFRDSLAYVPTTLAKFPALVGIPDLRKGDFPHRFNRLENWNKIVAYPSKEDFDYNRKSDKDRLVFDQWYEQDRIEKNGQYDFNQEFNGYCSQDVTVLRQCCLKFRELYMEVSTGICPFASGITIANIVTNLWRTRFLKDNTIGLVHRFDKGRTQSAKALKWLEWTSHELGTPLRTRISGGEKKIGKFFVDGFSEEDQRVYEFYGCHWHGCPKCFRSSTLHPQRLIQMGLIHKETMDREEVIRRSGYSITAIWEHEYEELLKTDLDFRDFVENVHIHTPLNPRDAFKGGRVNAYKLLHNVEPDEKIHYFDVTSEYPFINKYGKYPIGHPEVIKENFKTVDQYYGLVKCKLLPPRGLLIPVIPATINKKLYSPLCRTCAGSQQKEKCHHSDEERALSGTWCSPEIDKAVSLGYQVLAIEEVWHYPETKVGLFADYMNTFLKLKTEASGWPDDVITSEQKDQYIRDFHSHEGVLLEKEKIKKNPGFRQLSKLCLNSLWGRLGMRENKGKTEFVTEPQRFHERMISGMYNVSSFDLFSDDVMCVQYKSEEDFIDVNPSTNVVLAAFTTSLARLHLYKFMEQLGPQLLYCDTDSVVFKHKPGQYMPPTGNYLGDLTSELKPDQWITSFASLGPKCYGWVSNTGEHCLKIKGHTINGETKEQLNFNNLVKILSDNSVELIKYSNVLKRNKKELSIYQTDMTKKWRVTYEKRVIVDDQFNTLPYGYLIRAVYNKIFNSSSAADSSNSDFAPRKFTLPE